MKYDDLQKNMGWRIYERRKALGLSQEYLAELADVSPQMISTAERGEKAILSENLLKLSRALGVTTDYLLTGEVTEADVSGLTEKLRRLPAEKLHIVERIIDACLELSE